jgi:hypothetical protein
VPEHAATGPRLHTAPLRGGEVRRRTVVREATGAMLRPSGSCRGGKSC